jgi:virulence factor Mce-like protein
MSSATISRGLLRKIYGLVFLSIIGLLFLLVVGLYNQSLPWQHSVTVYVEAGQAGNQLNLGGDVKVRGAFVGTIKSISANGNEARITLRLQPDKAKEIPRNVTARMLPKTIFGEKFVELEIPANPSSDHLHNRDVIPKDKSKTAIETDKVFEDLLPLLQTLQPVKLNRTLYALATALERQGNALGNNLALADRYFSTLNPNLPTINHDISGLADLANSLGAAAPDLLRFAANSAASLQGVVVPKQTALETFFTGTKGFADTARRVVSKNEDNFIHLADYGKDILGVFAHYSDEFPCLLRGLTDIQSRLEGTFATGPYLYVHLVPLAPQTRSYTYPNDQPQQSNLYYNLPRKNGVVQPPSCAGLPMPGVQYTYPHPGVSQATVNANAAALQQNAYGDIGPVGSAGEQSFVQALASPLLNVSPSEVPAITDLLLGPMLRGAAVSLQ